MLSDTNYDAARSLGLMDHEKPGMPTPATLVLDSQGGVLLSTLNQGGNCLFAGDILEYARNLKRADPAAAATIPAPQLAWPTPGTLRASVGEYGRRSLQPIIPVRAPRPAEPIVPMATALLHRPDLSGCVLFPLSSVSRMHYVW